MRIALINPWTNAAESQAAAVIQLVAQNLGHCAYVCRNTKQALDGEPDFIISMSLFVPKLSSIPTYGLIHEPRDLYLQNQKNLQHFFSYDGFFTLSDTLNQFIRDLMHAGRREVDIGEFYCATGKAIDWGDESSFENARLAYFGINWDRRHEELFRVLDKQPWMEVFGPPRGWEFLSRETYRGMAPFDGISNLRFYHAAGAGLCLMTDRHLADDVISGRIFEITAAGAIAIAPQMPWLKKHFGDSLLYIDQNLPHRELAMQIQSWMDWIHTNPQMARSMAQRSHEIFRKNFSMDVTFPNILRYHENYAKGLLIAAHSSTTENPLISVVLRCTDYDAIRRTIESLIRQDYRNLELTLCVEDSSVLSQLPDYNAHFRRVSVIADDIVGSKIWQALRAATGKYLAVMRDGIEVWPTHFSSLVTSMSDAEIAYSGTVCRLAEPYYASYAAEGEDRVVRFFPLDGDGLIASADDPPLHTMLFSRQLMDRWLLDDPKLQTTEAQERYLKLCLLQRSKANFSYKVSVLEYEADEQKTLIATRDLAKASVVQREPNMSDYPEDEARLKLRLLGQPGTMVRSNVRFEDLRSLEITQYKRIRRTGNVTEYLLSDYAAGSFDLEERWQPVPLQLAQADMLLFQGAAYLSEDVLPIEVKLAPEAWRFGLMMCVRFPDDRPYVVRLRCQVKTGVAGIGVLNPAGNEFLYRVIVPSQPGDILVNVPIPRPIESGLFVIQAGDGLDILDVKLEGVELLAGDSSRSLPFHSAAIHAGQMTSQDGTVEYLLTGWHASAFGPRTEWGPLHPNGNQIEAQVFGGSDERSSFPLTVRPPDEAWAIGALIQFHSLPDEPSVLRLRCRVSGRAGFAVLNQSNDEILYRTLVNHHVSSVLVYLPIHDPQNFGGFIVQATEASPPPEIVIEEASFFGMPQHSRKDAIERIRIASSATQTFSSGVRRRSPDGTVDYRLSEPYLDIFESYDLLLRVPIKVGRDNVESRSGTNDHWREIFPLEIWTSREGEPSELKLRLPFPEDRPYIVRLHAVVEAGSAVFGIASHHEDGFLYQVRVASGEGHVTVDLPVLEPVSAGPIIIADADPGVPTQITLEKLEVFE